MQGILQGTRHKGPAKQLGVPEAGCIGESSAHSEVPTLTETLRSISVDHKHPDIERAISIQGCIERGSVRHMLGYAAAAEGK